MLLFVCLSTVASLWGAAEKSSGSVKKKTVTHVCLFVCLFSFLFFVCFLCFLCLVFFSFLCSFCFVWLVAYFVCLVWFACLFVLLVSLLFLICLFYLFIRSFVHSFSRCRHWSKMHCG